MNEAGGKHYGEGLQPWDLQKCMKSSGNAFVDARRADAIKYSFRIKGDSDKQLDDLKKARHCLDEAIKYIEDCNAHKEEDLSSCIPHILDNYHLAIFQETGTYCSVCGESWPVDQIPKNTDIPVSHPAYKGTAQEAVDSLREALK
jgi:hypothetical protein